MSDVVELLSLVLQYFSAVMSEHNSTAVWLICPPAGVQLLKTLTSGGFWRSTPCRICSAGTSSERECQVEKNNPVIQGSETWNKALTSQVPLQFCWGPFCKPDVCQVYLVSG